MKTKLNSGKDRLAGLNIRFPKQLQTSWNNVWHQFGIFWVNLLLPSQEPVIREIVDRHGKKKWRVYDPVIDRSIVLNSPEEVCIWLEESRRLNRFWYF
ncbi:MAG: hypothetical protein Kow00121_38270 [Elainellaceae cyanobacterium]